VARGERQGVARAIGGKGRLIWPILARSRPAPPGGTMPGSDPGLSWGIGSCTRAPEQGITLYDVQQHHSRTFSWWA